MAEERRNGPTEEQGRERESRLARAYEREHEVVEELRALDEMKNAFLSALSHELRTPVTAILGLARTIENDHGRLSPDEVREFMRRIASKPCSSSRLIALRRTSLTGWGIPPHSWSR